MFPAFLQLFAATHMENGKEDEEGINNEGHDVGKRSEGEGHPGYGSVYSEIIQIVERNARWGRLKFSGRRPRLGLYNNSGATQRGELKAFMRSRDDICICILGHFRGPKGDPILSKKGTQNLSWFVQQQWRHTAGRVKSFSCAEDDIWAPNFGVIPN